MSKIFSISAAMFGVLSLSVSSANSQEPEFNARPALPFPPGVTLESQCGLVDDLQHVELYDGTLGVSKAFVAEHEPTTFQLQWFDETDIFAALPDHAPGNVGGQRWCTATLISPSTALTAGHCFDIGRGGLSWLTPHKFDATGRPIFAEPEVLATLFKANFGYQLSAENGQLREPDVFPVTALLEYRHGDLDYAIIELGQNGAGQLPGDLGHTPGVLDVRSVTDGESLTIIQHPQGDPKKIEAGGAQTSSNPWLFYDNIDTRGGSSGSAVRDSDGEVVAVHTNGGCTETGGGANRGVLLRSIADVSDLL